MCKSNLECLENMQLPTFSSSFYLLFPSYEYDCCGFVYHVLERSSPQAYDELRRRFHIPQGACVGIANWNRFAQVNVQTSAQRISLGCVIRRRGRCRWQDPAT